ncbi:MAG: hypothetical protein O7C75_14540 [Verrucomicrobia bacterium]|nr:hypothetical protein [Verrucomicrobiota bacterium]
MRLSKSLYASGVLNNGKVAHCNEWDIGDYQRTQSTVARFVDRAQLRWEEKPVTRLTTKPSRWKFVKNVLRIG